MTNEAPTMQVLLTNKLGPGYPFMESTEEINKELEGKLKKLEEDVINVMEYNNKLKEVMEGLKAEERLTLEWLLDYLNNSKRLLPSSSMDFFV